MTSTPSTTERAHDTASTAADEGKHVAGVAKDEAHNVASQAKDQALGVMDDAMSQVHHQSRAQRDRLVETLRGFSDDLEQMAGQSDRSGMASQAVRQVADRTRGFTDHIDGREPMQLLDDVRDFARRRPGTFLLGALAAGVVAGRLVRGAKDGDSGTSVRSAPSDSPAGTATGRPLAGTGYPESEPAYPADAGTGYPTTAGGVVPSEPTLGLDPEVPAQRPTEGGAGL